MKVCFVGHSFHQRTGSSRFFTDLLQGLGDVTEILVDPDAPPLANDKAIRELLASNSDVYIFWQTEWVAERLPLDLGRSFIVPMYDAVRYHPSSYWKRFVKFHFISFSRALHETLQSVGCTSSHFQYFPEPLPVPNRSDEVDKPSAFFWERRPLEPLSLPLVAKQCTQLGVGRLFLHAVPDFADDAQPRESGRIGDVDLCVSGWHETRQAATLAAGGPTYFFAPRAVEGIGMATLEAMARGQIVIAPDLPTANEYVSHRVTGLLYDPSAPTTDLALAPLDLAARRQMGEAARRRIRRGHETWLRDTDRLQSLLVGDGRRWPTTDASAGFANAIREAAYRRRHHDR